MDQPEQARLTALAQAIAHLQHLATARLSHLPLLQIVQQVQLSSLTVHVFSLPAQALAVARLTPHLLHHMEADQRVVSHQALAMGPLVKAYHVLQGHQSSLTDHAYSLRDQALVEVAPHMVALLVQAALAAQATVLVKRPVAQQVQHSNQTGLAYKEAVSRHLQAHLPRSSQGTRGHQTHMVALIMAPILRMITSLFANKL